MKNWVENPDNFSIILRFLGTTIDTSSIYKSYSSIALQLHFIATILQKEKKHYYSKENLLNYEQYCKISDMSSLISFLFVQFERIRKLDSKRKILILLDSLDQLTPTDYKNVSHWLFTTLPSNVKLIVSTIPDHGDLLNAIKKRLKTENEIDDKTMLEKQMLVIETLSTSLSEKILREWLLAKNKDLTSNQWVQLRHMFDQSHLLPLYIQLIFDIVFHWRSFDQIDDKFLMCRRTDDVIRYLFERMEELHGKVIFSHAIFYMTACKNGISEQELEDILSLDDEVLMSVFQYHMPPIRRIPFILWVRIRNELFNYIDEREANDVKVIQWHHRRFIEVAIKMYIEPMSRNNEHVFQNIVDFYNETWKSKQKPFKVNDYLKIKLKLDDENIVADRFISSQPIEYVKENGEVHYNKRKLTELPNCLANISSSIALEKACNLIFYNYQFLHAKFSCDSLSDVLDDLKRIMQSFSSMAYSEDAKMFFNALSIINKIFMLCGDLLQDYPDSLGFQITSRLLIIYQESEIITHFINECDSQSIQHCAFVSPYYQLPSPGGLLIGSLNKHYAPITHVIPIIPYFFTLSVNKIDIVKDNKKSELYSLFQINLPMSGVCSWEDIEEYKNFKPILLVNLSQLLSREEVETPENFPIDFLLITKSIVFVIAPNRDIKFKYETDTEILDAICISQKHLIIIEKDKNTIKLFQNYVFSAVNFTEFSVSDDKSKKIVKICSKNSINTSLNSVNFFLIFSDSSFKKLTICSIEPVKNEFKEKESNGNIFYNEQHEKLDHSHDFKIYDFFKIRVEENILPKFPECTNAAKRDAIQFDNVEPVEDLDTYLSTTDGTFIVANENLAKKLTNFLIFENALKEPIKTVYSFFNASKKPFFIIITENYMYEIHKDCHEQEGYCFVELKGRFDCITLWSDNSILVSENGLINVLKITCLKDTHRIKSILSFNAHSDAVTNIVKFSK